jgi:uncharacterized protein (DUF427 family)
MAMLLPILPGRPCAAGRRRTAEPFAFPSASRRMVTAMARMRKAPRARSIGARRPLAGRRGRHHIQPVPSAEATMQTKPVLTPGPDHPITITPNPRRIVVSVAGRVVADTHHALTLQEGSYPPVQYIPRADVDMALLHPTAHATYCPYKGDCAYYSIPLGGVRSTNAGWTYESPYAAVAAIRDYLAFYPDRVDAIEERPGG